MRPIAIALPVGTAACTSFTPGGLPPVDGGDTGNCTGNFLAFSPANFNRCIIEEPTMDLIASGGGGGEGADTTTSGLPGNAAGNADVANPAGGATMSNGAGGNGGNGGASVEPQGGTAGQSAGGGVARGGGGGGGSYGRIRINQYAGTLQKDDSRIVPAASVKDE